MFKEDLRGNDKPCLSLPAIVPSLSRDQCYPDPSLHHRPTSPPEETGPSRRGTPAPGDPPELPALGPQTGPGPGSAPPLVAVAVVVAVAVAVVVAVAVAVVVAVVALMEVVLDHSLARN